MELPPLVDVEAFGRYMKPRAIDPQKAADALAMASGQVRDHCGWPITAETTTFVLDGSPSQLLSLPTLLLTAVKEVRVLGRPIAHATFSGWASGEQYTWSRRGQLFRAAGWPDRFQSVEADVEHGYAETPSTVAMVVCGLAEAYLPHAGRELAAKTVGAVTHTYRDTSTTAVLTAVQVFQLAGYTL